MKQTSVLPILHLIYHLTRAPDRSGAQCDADMHWLLCWLAHPLKRPAKLETAVILHGEPGSGKSLLCEVMQEIYGESGTTVSHEQTREIFNGWRSRKRFVVVDEVPDTPKLMADEAYLSSLITPSKVRINEKFKPARVEHNRANFIFLSGAASPLQLDSGDRRFFVVRHRGDRNAAQLLAQNVSAWRRDGGAAEFHRYLRHYPSTGFSRPPHEPSSTGDEARSAAGAAGEVSPS